MLKRKMYDYLVQWKNKTKDEKKPSNSNLIYEENLI